MEIIEFSHVQLSLARGISVSQKNNTLTNRIILQISGKKQISALTVKNGTTVVCPFHSTFSANFKFCVQDYQFCAGSAKQGTNRGLDWCIMQF